MDLPIIRVQLDTIRASFQQALVLHQQEFDLLVKETLAKVLSEDNLKREVSSVIRHKLKEIVALELEHYLRHGPGRKKIADAVLAALSEDADG